MTLKNRGLEKFGASALQHSPYQKQTRKKRKKKTEQNRDTKAPDTPPPSPIGRRSIASNVVPTAVPNSTNENKHENALSKTFPKTSHRKLPNIPFTEITVHNAKKSFNGVVGGVVAEQGGESFGEAVATSS